MNKLKLKEVLKEKGVTGKELSKLIGATENTISSIKNHLKSPTFDTLTKIADALNIDVCDLIEANKSDKVYIIIKDEMKVFSSLGKLKEFITNIEQENN